MWSLIIRAETLGRRGSFSSSQLIFDSYFVPIILCTLISRVWVESTAQGWADEALVRRAGGMCPQELEECAAFGGRGCDRDRVSFGKEPSLQGWGEGKLQCLWVLPGPSLGDSLARTQEHFRHADPSVGCGIFIKPWTICALMPKEEGEGVSAQQGKIEIWGGSSLLQFRGIRVGISQGETR